MKLRDTFGRTFARQPSAVHRGRLGEEAAARFLRSRGYRIVERNLATRAGEIDLIALDGDTLCFVEVKARSRSDYGPAAAAVDAKKRRRLVRAATLYLGRSGHTGPCRFDILTLERHDGDWRFEHFEGAFVDESGDW